jgi:hypothetical protein
VDRQRTGRHPPPTTRRIFIRRRLQLNDPYYRDEVFGVAVQSLARVQPSDCSPVQAVAFIEVGGARAALLVFWFWQSCPASRGRLLALACLQVFVHELDGGGAFADR